MKILRKRKWFQSLSALLFNLNIPLFAKGAIHKGQTKGICVPILNCYSCPAALGACPIGALQNSLANLRFNLSLGLYQLGLYVIGSISVVGSLIGRLPCGWLCPFGLIQELLYKIPSPKFKIPGYVKYFRYAVLIIFVILMPLLLVDSLGLGQTWFCKLICPAGTLEAGIPLLAANPALRSQVGILFAWKFFVLTAFLIWMVLSLRPFCRTICPLGTILGFFNKASLFQMHVDDDKCTQCGLCSQICPVGLEPNETPNSPECIRCLKCLDTCTYGAIDYNFLKRYPVTKPKEFKI